MIWTLEDFVRESNKIEGILRPATSRELAAYEEFLALKAITVPALEVFVNQIQPNARLRREAGLNVHVGNHTPPLGGVEIVQRLENILTHMHKHSPFKTHISYEELHPFTDGNGRSGRVLWLWMMGGEAPLGFLHQFYYQALGAT